MDEDEIVTNYFYDLAYFEGVRNTLQIFHKGFTHINHSLDTPDDKVAFVLKEIRKELDDAREMHKESEKLFLEFQSPDFY